MEKLYGVHKLIYKALEQTMNFELLNLQEMTGIIF